MQYKLILCIMFVERTNNSNTTVKLIAIPHHLSTLLQWQITQFVNFRISATVSNISTIIRSRKDCNHLMFVALPISLLMNFNRCTYFHHPFMTSNDVFQGIVKKKLLRSIYSIHLTDSTTRRIPSLLFRRIRPEQIAIQTLLLLR